MSFSPHYRRTRTRPRLVSGPTLAVFTLLGLAGCDEHGASTAAAIPAGETLAAVAQRVAREADIPGLAIAVIDSNGVDSAVDGVRRVGQTAALAAQDRMHLGSNIKAMTATLVASLVESGVVRWSTTIVDVFPELRATMRPEYLDVTVDDLLAHRGGILLFVDPASFAQLPPLAADKRAALTAWLVQQPSTVTPKLDSLYSNAGYVVLASMIERLAGQRYEDLLASRVLTPLSITPKFDWPAAGDPQQPWGHEWIAGHWVPSDPNAEANQLPAFATPAGNLSISVNDYARFIQAHLRGLRGIADVISASSYRHLHSSMGRYALGWINAPINGVRTSAHDGSAGTFYALAAIQADRDRAVVVLVNAYSKAATDTANTLALEMLAQGK